MKKIYFVVLASFLMMSTVFASGLEIDQEKENMNVIQQGKYENGYRYNIQGWIYLHLEGNGYERGYQHGHLLSAEIVDHINRWSNIIHNSPMFANTNIDQESQRYKDISNKWWNFCRNRINKIYWDRYPEEYQQEIQGIVDGVNGKGGTVFEREIDYKDILGINQMFEFMTRLTTLKKGFHPLRGFYNSIKNLIPTGLPGENEFIDIFLKAPPAHHCNAFIASGDATTNGQIVASHGIRCGGWWYPYYVAQRWNVVTDIVPSEGYRFSMVSSPGFIWSDDNYYQNEEGIIIMDTTAPQGLWKNKGYSMVIRTRIAAQYSSSLDEALYNLQNKNDGLWTAVYLIGDTETGEIARLDLALYNSKIWRQKNGYYWSANNLMDLGTRFEANGLGLKGLIFKIIGSGAFGYFTLRYFDTPRDAKLKELGEKYYGEIDVEVLKDKIMYEFPVCDSASTDVKLTDTSLLKENSLWVFFGNVGGMIWNTSDQKANLKGVKDVPPQGWTLINGLPMRHDFELPEKQEGIAVKNSEVRWEYDFAEDYEGRNSWFANLDYNDDVLYGAASDGNIYSISTSTGGKIWTKKVNNYDERTWINAEDSVVAIGWENQTIGLKPSNGEIVWSNDETKYICSNPVFLNDKIFFGNRNGEIYALDKENGKILWSSFFEKQKVYLTKDSENNRIVATCGKNCYSINPKNGDIIWEFETQGFITSQAKTDDKKVYFGSADTNLYAVDLSDGELCWNKTTGWGIQTTPDIQDNKVFVGSMDHNMYCFNKKTGEVKWSFTTNAAIQSSPVAYGDYVFFGSDDGRFYALNQTNGELAWNYAPAYTIDNDVYNYITTAITGDCIVEDGEVFMSANGKIFSLDAQTIGKKIEEKEEEKIPSEIILLIAVIAVLLLALFLGVYIYLKNKKE